MVKVERSFPAPASLALESQKANGSVFDAGCRKTVEGRFP